MSRLRKALTMDWLARERELWEAGYSLIAGVDEAGRGPLAGPVVAAAVILPQHIDIPGVVDSKRMSTTARQEAADRIVRTAVAVAVAAVSAKTIDRCGILTATMRAMTAAVNRLDPAPQFVIVDGNRCPDSLPVGSEAIVAGDAHSRSIAAASVIAKVTRDRLMLKLHNLHPCYGFQTNKGYGTEGHLQALAVWGPSPHHRFSFNPVGQRTLAVRD